MKAEKKDWTVMVYISGDNDLSVECVWALKEMYRAGVNDKVALVVQIDPTATAILRYDVGAHFEESKKNGLPVAPRPKATGDDIDGELFERGSEVPAAAKREEPDSIARGKAGRPPRASDDIASPEMLKQFIIDCRNAHPADHYLLILSGHGGPPLGHSFLIDEFPPRGLSLAELSEAIKNTRGEEDAKGKIIDVIGMDSCSMGMAEVGYELRGSAEYLVASQGFEQNTGWPYHKVLEVLNTATKKLEPREVAANIVKVHTDYYSDYLMAGVSTDISACELAKSTDLANAIKQLVEVLRETVPLHTTQAAKKERREGRVLSPPQLIAADPIILAHWRAQSYGFERHVDLYDFCDLFQKGSGDKRTGKACEKVKQVIKGKMQADGTYDGYVINSRHSGGSFQYSNGVAVYFPWAEFFEEYFSLKFSRKTNWGRFVREYVQTTRRCPRDGSGRLLSIPQVDDSSTGVRSFPEAGIRSFPEAGIRGKMASVPIVKNPPDLFFEDNC